MGLVAALILRVRYLLELDGGGFLLTKDLHLLAKIYIYAIQD